LAGPRRTPVGWRQTERRRLVAKIFVEDSDALFDRAVQAGAKIIMPMTDMFFGSREGRIADPFGNVRTIATLKEEVAPAEIQRRKTELKIARALCKSGPTVCKKATALLRARSLFT
jgi:hypothetical protein